MKINKKKLWYYILWIFWASLIAILIINFYVLSFYKGVFYTNVDSLENHNVWLVLWASVYKNRTPSDILKDRLDVALDAYNKWKVQKLILSGDNSINEYNEPVTMQKYLLEAWVRETDLYLDYAGFDTYDSLYRTRDIFWIKKIVIFTQDYHLKRAIYIWKRLWIETYWVSANEASSVIYSYLNPREILARVKAFMEVELLAPKPRFLWERVTIKFETEAEKELLKLFDTIDMESDTSIHKFVNNKVSFKDLEYIPEELIELKGPLVDDLKWYWTLRKKAKHALGNMSKDFYWHFKENIEIFSSYRSYLYQKGIKDRGCPDNLCAKAGYSEHQTGLAIDLWEASTEKQFLSNPKYKQYFDWLNKNAHKYGFHNTYQRWLDVDWYEVEPWHWRYLWIKLATYLKENNLTFAELYNKKKPN